MKNLLNAQIFLFTIYRKLDIAKDTLVQLRMSGFNVNFFTLKEFLKSYAKRGDIRNIKQILDSFPNEKIILRDENVLNVMCDLSSNGHSTCINELFPYFKSNHRQLEKILTILIDQKDAQAIQKILTSISSNIQNDVKYLIQQLIQLNADVDFFDEIINNLQSFGITIEKNFDTIKQVIEGPSIDLIHQILNYMSLQSMPINENHFTVLIQLAAKNGENELLKTVKSMCVNFNVQPNILFIRDIIIPNLKDRNNTQNLLKKLQLTKLDSGRIAIALTNYYIYNGNLVAACKVANNKNLRFYYGSELVIRPFLRVYEYTTDISNYTRLLKLIFQSIQRVQKYEKEIIADTNTIIKSKQQYFIDEVLNTVIAAHLKGKSIEPFLKAIEIEGFSLNADQVDKIRSSLKRESIKIKNILDKLNAGKLMVTNKRVQKKISSFELQKRLEHAQESNKPYLQKRLFHAYLRERKLSEVKLLLISKRFELKTGDIAQMINLYVLENDLQNALDILKQTQEKNKSFKLDFVKVARLVSLMIDSDRDYNEIELILMTNKREFSLKSAIAFEHIFDRLAFAGKFELLTKLYDTALRMNYIEASSKSARPFIYAHLINNNFCQAVNAYKYICQTYRISPMTKFLMTKLIQKNQSDLLNSVYNTYSNLTSQQRASTCLAFAYVACGRDLEARFIFEDEQIQNVSTKLSKMCQRYERSGDIVAAETLLKATKCVFCDRNIIYETLLNIYIKMNLVDKALKLWTYYEAEDDICPSNSFIERIKKFTEKNNLDVSKHVKIN